MTIWVDSDSLPRDLRAILLRRQGRDLWPGEPMNLRFVAGRHLPDIPPALEIMVEPGPDAADRVLPAITAQG